MELLLKISHLTIITVYAAYKLWRGGGRFPLLELKMCRKQNHAHVHIHTLSDTIFSPYLQASFSGISLHLPSVDDHLNDSIPDLLTHIVLATSVRSSSGWCPRGEIHICCICTNALPQDWVTTLYHTTYTLSTLDHSACRDGGREGVREIWSYHTCKYITHTHTILISGS
jgi:hypothetical protein